MRRVLVDVARTRSALKRDHGDRVIPIESLDVAAPEDAVDIVALEDALAALASIHPRPSQVVGASILRWLQHRRDR